jgi:integrase
VGGRWRAERPPPGIRERDGRYQVRYYGSNGERRAKSFDRLSDAKRFKREQDVKRDRNEWIDPRKPATPFDEWAWEWHHGRHRLHDRARRRDESLLRNHVIGQDRHEWGFGSTPLGKVAPLDVRAWVNAMVEAGYKPRTIRPAYRIFGAIMRAAVAAKMILEAPIGRDVVELPEIERKRERFLSDRELERFVREFDPYYRTLIYSAAYTGCRWQELTGLLRDNLDLDAGKLNIRTVVERGNPDLKEIPKTDAGLRTIALPPPLVEMLRFHLKGAPKSDLVFPGRKGKRVNESNFRRRHWNPAVTRARLEPLTFHDLRHTPSPGSSRRDGLSSRSSGASDGKTAGCCTRSMATCSRTTTTTS